MSYLLSAWYVAAFADEVPAGAMLARMLLDERVVLFRDAAGVVKAIADRCPHRFAPLSLGKLCDGIVQCPYHGLQFDGTGRCVHNPHGPAIPKAAKVRAYPVMERYGLIWFWPGDVKAAEATSIPDYSFTERAPIDATVRGYILHECNYELFVDNILDLTHADYVHAGGLGSGAITRSRVQVTDINERTALVAWYSSGDIAPTGFDMNLRRQGEPTDQWTEVTWTAPSNMYLNVGATLVGEPRDAGANTCNLHLSTPETQFRTHYWYWTTRKFGISPEINMQVRAFIEYAFHQQDKPMLQAQALNMRGNDFWSLQPILLPGDAGAVRVRRKLAALIESESASTRM